jgi:hypothetical protein
MRTLIACVLLALPAALPLAAADTPVAANPAPQLTDSMVLGFLASLDQQRACPSPSMSPVGPGTPSRMPSLPGPLQPQRPTRMDGLVSCDACGPPNSPWLQCERACHRSGLCCDQCYADATTCALASYDCLLC